MGITGQLLGLLDDFGARLEATTEINRDRKMSVLDEAREKLEQTAQRILNPETEEPAAEETPEVPPPAEETPEPVSEQPIQPAE